MESQEVLDRETWRIVDGLKAAGGTVEVVEIGHGNSPTILGATIDEVPLSITINVTP